MYANLILAFVGQRGCLRKILGSKEKGREGKNRKGRREKKEHRMDARKEERKKNTKNRFTEKII